MAMKPLRLCFVGPAASVTFRRWVEWFADRGHRTSVVTVEPADGPTKFVQVDVSTPLLPRKLGRLLSAARAALAVQRLKPDVVHVHYARGLAWGLNLAGRHPLIVTPWGSDVLAEQGAFREWYSRGLTGRLLAAADLVTVHSLYMEERVRPLLPRTTPIVRIGWGVDLKQFRVGLDVTHLRERWGIGPERRVVFSPRLAQPLYQHELVIRALPLVRKERPEVLLVIPEQSADREYLEGLKRLTADLHIAELVRFVGAIPHEQMPLWLNLAEAMVMVPRSDGMPNTLLEGMACGAVPVLARLPQYDEVVRHGDNGFLVETDPLALATGILQALADPRKRRRIVEHNRTLVSEVGDQDREMDRLESWYADLAQGQVMEPVLQASRR
ncbi:MAG: glycosyltransferase family 4 protein [Nitrospirota bacterium]